MKNAGFNWDTQGVGKAFMGFRERVGVQPVTSGDTASFNHEAAITEVGASVGFDTLAVGVREIEVFSTVACYVAKTSGALASAGTGDEGDRHFIPANTFRRLPWFWNAVHFKATAVGTGAIYVEGRL